MNNYQQAEEKDNDRITTKFLLHKNKEENMDYVDTHSDKFGCPNTRDTASQPKEPSFCQLLTGEA